MSCQRLSYCTAKPSLSLSLWILQATELCHPVLLVLHWASEYVLCESMEFVIDAGESFLEAKSSKMDILQKLLKEGHKQTVVYCESPGAACLLATYLRELHIDLVIISGNQHISSISETQVTCQLPYISQIASWSRKG